jgi:hypothetical protein
MKATKEYVELKAKRYRLLRVKKTKGQILTEVVKTTGYGRKHVIRLLGSYTSRKHKNGRRPGRTRKLAFEDIFLIKEIRQTSNAPLITYHQDALSFRAFSITFGALYF